MKSMIQKRLLLPNRVRRPPDEGFSWVDRRFLQDYAARLSRDAILLYFFFTAVSDQQGLSFYSDSTIAVRLRLSEKGGLRCAGRTGHAGSDRVAATTDSSALAAAGREDELGCWEDYQQLAVTWRDEVANVRLHQTTRQRHGNDRSIRTGVRSPPSSEICVRY